MRPHAILWLVGSLFMACLAPFANAAPELTVESRVSRASVAEPEVHILLRNNSDRPVEFSLWLGYLPGRRKPACSGDLTTLDRNYPSRFVGWDGLSRNPSSGVVPPKGWVHRSMALGAGGLLAPCTVPYLLSFEGEEGARQIEGEVQVSKGEAIERGSPTQADIDLEAMVETDEVHHDRVVLRLLAANRSSKGAHLLITKRSFECAAPEWATWALHHTVAQGEDVGPFDVPANGWTVFTMSIEISGQRALLDCSVRLQVSADTDRGVVPIAATRSNLRPTGYYSGIEGR